jgi:flagellar biosynthesis chaperone FliJ
MKRFAWPLQRLLEVTCQREAAMRTEFLVATRRVATLRHEMLARSSAVRNLLEALAAQNPSQRLAVQEAFMKASPAEHRAMAKLASDLKAAQDNLSHKRWELLRIRASRKSLERLRGEALARHVREQLRLEQKQFDETSHQTYARTAQAAQR